MIRVTNSIALRFDVIGKTLETLMDKQLMKTTVNNELSSKKYAGKKEGTEKVSLQLFKELNLHIACILFGYVQIFCTLMP